jgi:hypothetical protein
MRVLIIFSSQNDAQEWLNKALHKGECLVSFSEGFATDGDDYYQALVLTSALDLSKLRGMQVFNTIDTSKAPRLPLQLRSLINNIPTMSVHRPPKEKLE